MNDSASSCVPLASLFAFLLSGCPDPGSCGGEKTYFTFELTPEEYAQWSKKPGPSGGTTGVLTTDSSGSTTGQTTTGGSDTGETTGTSTTDASGAGETTSADTTGGSGAGETTEESTTGIEEMFSEQEVCTRVCTHYASAPTSCSVSESADKFVVTCAVEEPVTPCKGGRLHACVISRSAAHGRDQMAAWLACAAHDEAASVHAFRSLWRELAALGAPLELLARVETAAQDEVRHAEFVSVLARAAGAEVPVPEVAEVPVRALLALALENAVEGCVHETWAALVAAHQARYAVHPEVRTIYRAIAADEARHAELAWAIDSWLSRQLGVEDRARVCEARRAAADTLAAHVAATVDAPELAALGLPGVRVAVELFAGLDSALWSRNGVRGREVEAA